jgi:phosphatidylserine/phosphatidylglycerophosphate/cardiolipin synthase-like enzyme
MGLRGEQNYDRWFSQPETRMNGVCRILAQTSGGTHQQIAPVLAEMIKVARDRIILTSPGIGYSPEDKKPNRWPQKLARIIKAQARDWGVRVDVLGNGLEGGSGELAYVLKRMEREIERQNLPFLPALLQSINAIQSRAAGRKDRVQMLDLANASPNIHTWTYFEFLHAKTWIFDRTAVSIGSMNWDDFSTEKSHESTAICMDRTLSNQFERQITLDLVNSLPVVSVNE